MPVGTIRWKYTLTTVMVMNEGGFGVPVAWLIHKYNHAEILRDFLDALAVQAGCAPDAAPVPYTERAPTPAGASVSTNPTSVAALRRFCPSHLIIDVAGVEIAAINASVWGRGMPVFAVVNGRHVHDAEASIEPAKIIYCDWHLKCAWGEAIKRHVRRGDGVGASVGERIMAGLKAIVGHQVRPCSTSVEQQGLLHSLTCDATQDAADAPRLIDEFCDAWRPTEPVFVAYFEKEYKPVYKRWVRACYLVGHEEDAFRIPRTTSHNEAYHSYLKKIDIVSDKCVALRAWRGLSTHAHAHSSGHGCVRAAWTGLSSSYTPPCSNAA